MKKLPTLSLPTHLARAVVQGHPWIYRNQLSESPNWPSGSLVRLRCDKLDAFALWDADSVLALRVFSREAEPDATWVKQRIAEAWRLRQSAVDVEQTNAFRWLNGEGDNLPGIVCDHYAGYAVVVLDSGACESLLPWVVQGLEACTQLKGIVRRHRSEQGAGRLEALRGGLPPKNLTVLEHGLRFRVNPFSGQKTGLFLDHRENRVQMEKLVLGKSVLNLFSYSGAFSLYAVRGGATEVVSVDVAPAAAQDAELNFRINGFDVAPHEFVVQDVFEYLEACRASGRRFDVVICDPPSIAHSQQQLKKALQAYTRVNAAGIKVTQQEGLYAAASCTSRVTPQAFIGSLADSARRARVRYQVLQDHGHAPDHPVNIAHPEGRYLKFVLGRILPRA